MGDIQFSGLASGLDTESMVSRLMQIDRLPLTRLEQKSSLYSYKKTLIQDINTKLLSVYNASKTLLSALDDIWSLKTTTSSDSNLLGVSASSSAIATTYNVIINKLAQAHTVRSDSQTSSTSPLYLSGKFYINGKEVSITYTDSLQSIQNKINSTADVGVTASIVDNALRIKNNETGAAQVTLSDELGASTLTANSSNPAVLSANITGNPVAADYDFTVSQLATQHEVASDAVADPAAALGQAGTFQVNGQPVNIIATDSLNDIRDKINAAGAGVTATVNGSNQLDIKSNTSGSAGAVASQDTAGTVLQNLGVLNPDNSTYKNIVANAQDAVFDVDGTGYVRSSNVFSDVVTDVEVTLSGTGTSTLTIYKKDAVLRNLGLLDAGGAIKNELVVAQDAKIEIDGQTVTRSSNIIDDAISGVTLTLKGESATAINVTVGSDTTSIKSKITDFVNAYNTAYKLVNDKLTESTVSKPKTETDRQKGVLRSDYQLRQIKSDLRRLIGLSVDGLPDDMEMLDQIGIHADKTGQLSIDDAELSDALNTDFDKVKNLFTNNYQADPYVESNSGIATRMDNYLYQITRSLTGDMVTRQTTIDNQVAQLQKSIDKWNIKLDKLEAKYRKQFRDMESAMQKMQTQSNWLTSQLNSLSQLSKTQKSSGTSIFG